MKTRESLFLFAHQKTEIQRSRNKPQRFAWSTSKATDRKHTWEIPALKHLYSDISFFFLKQASCGEGMMYKI